jgi:hypothetical protein
MIGRSPSAHALQLTAAAGSGVQFEFATSRIGVTIRFGEVSAR